MPGNVIIDKENVSFPASSPSRIIVNFIIIAKYWLILTLNSQA